MAINLKTLIAKLNDTTRLAATRAASICVGLGQYEVDIEHLFLALLEQEQSDFVLIARRCGISLEALDSDLRKEIVRFKSGSARTPVFSTHLPVLLEQAWLIASLSLPQPAQSQPVLVRSSHLLLALLTAPDLEQLAARGSPLFAGFPLEELKHKMAHYTRGSREQAAQALVTADEASDAVARLDVKTPALDQYTTSLTQQARDGKLDPVIGRESEIRQAMDILMRRRQNNPILTGEAGVGKTAVVEGLALRIVADDVPEMLRDIEIHTLDMGLLQAGASVKGEFENRLKNVIEEVRKSPRAIVLFIDEAHTIIGAGGQAGQNDAANLLKPALARGELRTIAATTWSEYKKYFEKDAALARRFQVIKVEEPGEDVACAMLRAMAPLMERHFGLKVRDEAVTAAVRLSHRYICGRQLPDKAVGLLDTACARVKLDSAASAEEAPAVDAQAVAAIVAAWTGIPLGHMVRDDIRAVRQLQGVLEQRILGQQHAMAAVAQRMRSARAGLDDPDRPKGVFLFAGPSGVGKTETALALADALYGGERKLITINMNEYQEAHSVSGLKGSPPGYVGYGEGGVLTEAVRRNPYSVLLLDEIEKAHPDVAELFFQVFDKGVLDDAEGRTVDFRNTVIIATSNLASAAVMQACLNKPAKERPSPAELDQLVRPALTQRFKAAFLGRLQVVPFYPIADEVLANIIALRLERVGRRLRASHQADFSYDQAVVEAVLARCTEVDSGARNVDRILEGTLLPEIAEALLARMADGVPVTSVKVGAGRNGQFKYTIK